MKTRKLALFGSVAMLFATSLFAASKPIQVYAEGDETESSEVIESSSEEAVEVSSELPVEQPAAAEPAEEAIPDDKWASFEQKTKEIIAKIFAIATTAGASLFLGIKIVIWLVDRKIVKKKKEAEEKVLEAAGKFNEARDRFEHLSTVQITEAKTMMAQSKEMAISCVDGYRVQFEQMLKKSEEQLEQSKKEARDLKQVLAVILKMDPAMVAAGAYKQALPYLEVNEDGGEG